MRCRGGFRRSLNKKTSSCTLSRYIVQELIMVHVTSLLPANCTLDTFLTDECTELPLSLANAEDLLAQLEPTPD